MENFDLALPQDELLAYHRENKHRGKTLGKKLELGQNLDGGFEVREKMWTAEDARPK